MEAVGAAAVLSNSKWKLLQRAALLRRTVAAMSEQEIFTDLERKHMEQKYYLRDKPQSQYEVTVHTNVVELKPFINQHIIIMGKGLSNLVDLIRPLRAKYLGSLRIIVIIYPVEIPYEGASDAAEYS